MALRVYLAFGSGTVGFIALCLIPVAYFGDKNETWTARLVEIAALAAFIFLLAIFW